METKLKSAVLKGRLDKVKSLLSTLHYRHREANELGLLLHYTINTEIAYLLLDNGANPNVRNPHGETPLFSAVRNKDCKLDLIRALLERNADVNAISLDLSTPLHSLVETANCRLDIIKELLKQGANVNMRNNRGDTPLHIIVRKCDTKMDIEKAFQTLCRSRLGHPLHIPRKIREIDFAMKTEQIFPSSLEIVKELLLYGSDVNIPNSAGMTPLHIAVEKPHFSLAIINEILENGANVAATMNIDGKTPLHLAVSNLNCTVDLVTMLLNRGASTKEVDKRGNTPLHLILVTNLTNIDVLRKLLKHGVNINARNCAQNTPLHEASSRRCYLLSELLKWSPDIHAKDIDGNTALSLFVQYCKFDLHIFMEMLKAGADVNSVNYHFETPLHKAVTNCGIVLEEDRENSLTYQRDGVMSVVNSLSKLLGSSKPQLNVLNECADKLIHRFPKLLREVKDTNFIKVLLKNGACIAAPSLTGKTPLQTCIRNFEVKLDNGLYLSSFLKSVVLREFEINSSANINLSDCKDPQIQRTLNNFVQSCISELTSMKNDKVGYTLTLYEFMTMEYFSREPQYTFNMEISQMLDKIFCTLLNNKYRIYSDMIFEKVDRTLLVDKVTCQELYTVVANENVRNENKKVILNHDCSFYVIKYLDKRAILNLYFAFSDCIQPKDLTEICTKNLVPIEFYNASITAAVSVASSAPCCSKDRDASILPFSNCMLPKDSVEICTKNLVPFELYNASTRDVVSVEKSTPSCSRDSDASIENPARIYKRKNACPDECIKQARLT